MRQIVPIVESYGDVQAVPFLLRRILQERFQVFDWQVARPKKADSLAAFTNKLSNFLQYAFLEPSCGAVLILFDLDDGCPKESASQLAQRLRAEYCRAPVAVVLAHREFESWFLASAETLAGKFDLSEALTYPDEVEIRRDAKGWLTEQMPPGMTYKETFHQEKMVARLDLALAYQRSRSFRRLVHALEQIIRAETPIVTP